MHGSEATVTSCLFTGNTSSFRAGGVEISHDATMVNCTFSRNTAAQDGGGVFSRRDPTFTNCVFWGNEVANGINESAQLHVESGTPVVTYSNFQGGWTGEGVHAESARARRSN